MTRTTPRPFNAGDYTAAPAQITKSRWIDAPIESVWSVVADHGGMTRWVPMISHVELTDTDDRGEYGEGCERACQFGPDLLRESIPFWDPPYGYAYQIADMRLVRDHVAHLKLRERDGGTDVTWTQYFHPNANVAMNFVSRKVMMPTLMTKALKNLAKEVALNQ